MAAPVLPDEEHEWVVQGFAELISKCGAEPFASGIFVRALPAHFPDRWTPDEAGVATMLRRLLAYAGIDNARVNVELFYEHAQQEHLDAPMVGNSWHKAGAAAWYAGRAGDTLNFGAEASELADPEKLVATLSHEVAHAWREQRGLVHEDRDEEELLTDLTTLYLGFGILTVNGSFRYRSSGDWVSTEWSFQQAGYLSPEAMSHALAVQAVARDIPARKLRSLLEPNQADAFSQSHRALKRGRPRLLAELGLSSTKFRSDLGVPGPLAPLTHSPIRPFEPEPAASAEEHPAATVFRVKRTWVVPFVCMGLLSLCVALPLAAIKGGPGLVPWVLIGLPLGSALVGGVLRRDHCSDPDCAGRIGAMDRTCRSCGGAVRGTLERARDRLVAEEALEREGQTPAPLSLTQSAPEEPRPETTAARRRPRR